MKLFLFCFGSLILIGSFLPLIRKDYWTFRVFEYPRIQKLVLTFVWLACWMIFQIPNQLFLNILVALMLLNLIYLSWQIFPFTPLGKKQVYKAAVLDEQNSIKIMLSNVYEQNNNFNGCIEVIKANSPDLVLLLETNHLWAKNTNILDQTYQHQVKVPIDNTYGMLLFSKFPILNPQVKFLVEDDIPSIDCQIELPSGQQIQIYAVHPTPPVPNENPKSTERDKELLIIAKKAEKCILPVIVCGDLNDVAWSYTTDLFLKTSKLLDPRRGRGFFNTFHAKMPLLQFPLDHAFTSAHFKLRKMKKLDNFNSDHYPIFVHLQYEPLAKAQQQKNQLDESSTDKETVQKKINADTSK